MEFPSNLKALRQAAKLSQEQLALQCGFGTQSRISNYESGAREPDMADLIALARTLRTTTDELLGVTPLVVAEDQGAYTTTADLEEVRTDILALRQSVLMLTAALIASAPASARVLHDALHDPGNRLPIDKNFLGELADLVVDLSPNQDQTGAQRVGEALRKAAGARQA